MDWKVILKVSTGFVVVPISIIGYTLWPWWTQAPLSRQIVSSIFILPLVALAAIVTPWWEDL